ncbi:MAG TPA: hypothetical protein VK088_11330, partial [Acidimicrobiia bacterium]|nr:hypothetical protein [Acidimicrobiia bacterium]
GGNPGGPIERRAMECQHQACTCTVDDGQFCSEACRNADPLVTGVCECGHEGCGAVVPMENDGPAVLPHEA